MNKRFTGWLSLLLIISLLAGCAGAADYVKETYPLVDLVGKGKETAKVYEAEGKDVPTVAGEIAAKEQPKETSKNDSERMFLVYDDKIINVQKNPDKPENSLVEVDTVEYAKQHYDSSFLQGYITASIIQSLFGGGWFGGGYHGSYRGYTSMPDRSYQGSSQMPSGSKSSGPTTSDRTGTFSSKSKSSSSSYSTRKNDGSSPSYKSSSKPTTSKRSGSFSKRR